ncbi:MAG: Cytosolic iron-sulfur protein assembly protein [Bathelium mastoideum]|nr:MAG: Cytosolic iron-sulfur protein assembly protein [Bathelium mastoideum]
MPPTTTIRPLAALTPPNSTRAWSSAPHPTLPLLATACSDRSVRVYSLASFTLHSTVAGGHKRSVRACAWKPGAEAAGGESVLATGSFDASAGIWRREVRRRDGEDIWGLRHGAGGEEDGNGDEDEDDDEWRYSVVLDGHDSEIKSIAWSAGATLLATCSRDKSVWIWEELPGEEDNFETVAVLQEHEGDVKCVVWHPEEELLASASYDDTVRLYREDVDDWTCVAILEGHDATVWCVDFEGIGGGSLGGGEEEGLTEEQRNLLAKRKEAGSRLVSCSDDLTIRIWRRTPRQGQQQKQGKDRMPSILKSSSVEEDWIEEARLPQKHDRAIYTVSWSRRTGRVVSTGSDGKIVVYEERWKDFSSHGNNGTALGGRADVMDVDDGAKLTQPSLTEWIVVAELEGAHDVYEVNHVCWSKRWDNGKQSDDEEIIISTSDDGEVKAWILD